MKTSQLLGELQGNILRDTSHAVTPASKLWTPESLVAYLQDAQVKFADETHCIVDSTTPEVTQIVLEEGEPLYELHESVLEVRAVKLSGVHANRRLKKVTSYEVEDGSDAYMFSVPSGWYTQKGLVQAYTTDDEPNAIRVFPVPDENMHGMVMRLKVVRLPITELVVPVEGDESTDRVPEIPSAYHLDLCEWAAYRALRNHDVEAEDIPKATTHRNQWERVVSKVRRRMRRKRMIPVTFGGKAPN